MESNNGEGLPDIADIKGDLYKLGDAQNSLPDSKMGSNINSPMTKRQGKLNSDKFIVYRWSFENILKTQDIWQTRFAQAYQVWGLNWQLGWVEGGASRSAKEAGVCRPNTNISSPADYLAR